MITSLPFNISTNNSKWKLSSDLKCSKDELTISANHVVIDGWNNCSSTPIIIKNSKNVTLNYISICSLKVLDSSEIKIISSKGENIDISIDNSSVNIFRSTLSTDLSIKDSNICVYDCKLEIYKFNIECSTFRIKNSLIINNGMDVQINDGEISKKN